MADTYEETSELQVKVTMAQGNAQVTRTVSISNPDEDVSKAKLRAFRDKLISGSLSSVIQPANWRDNGEEADPYTTVGVEFVKVNTAKTMYDLN